jgi:hypothetical protein
VSTGNGGDTQRDLEQRALRNVRGLVDRIERDDAVDSRKQWKLVAAILACVFAGLLVALVFAGRRDTPTVPVQPAKPGQVMPQAPRAPQ